MISRKNVLLVDDDSIFNFLNEKVISRLNVAENITTAHNGQEALDVLARSTQSPDVIFLDLNMPVMDGFEFIEAYQQLRLPNEQRPVIIVVTSSADPRDIRKVKALGVDHYLSKPLTEDKLRTVFTEIFPEQKY